ncbi:ATP-binding protein [Streptomyces rimosus]|uniref:ATP-binding protein n=1 Tax=Streptomyces rimosus TaxID=1927 RepID=UPI0031D6DAB7
MKRGWVPSSTTSTDPGTDRVGRPHTAVRHVTRPGRRGQRQGGPAMHVTPQRALAYGALVPAPPRTFPGTARSVGQARTYARQIVERSVPGITEEQLAQVALLVSELVTNACRYGAEPGDLVAVGVTASPTGARIQVHDPARRRPRRKRPAPDSQRGRGLLIIEAVATAWGVADRPLGKIVWAELAW